MKKKATQKTHDHTTSQQWPTTRPDLQAFRGPRGHNRPGSVSALRELDHHVQHGARRPRGALQREAQLGGLGAVAVAAVATNNSRRARALNRGPELASGGATTIGEGAQATSDHCFAPSCELIACTRAVTLAPADEKQGATLLAGIVTVATKTPFCRLVSGSISR